MESQSKWCQPPLIFKTPLYDVEQTIVEHQSSQPETYALFFMRRQVYLGLPMDHPWVAEDAFDVGYQACHGGITYSSECLPDQNYPTRNVVYWI